MEYKVKIVPDECAENPCKEWDMLSKFFTPRSHFGNCKDFRNVEDFKEFMKRNRAGFFYPLYMYSHSGETISLSPFSCTWDSGQVGWVFVTKSQAVKEFGKKVTKEQIDKIVKAEVQVMDYYIRGEVYGYQIIDEDDDVVDSCYGFYGEYAIEAGNEALEGFKKEAA